MNSSGIKRGLAVSAISALAVTGIPALANPASAEVGDNFTVTYTGPALNGGDEGALVIIRAEDGEIDPTQLELTSTSSPTGGSQNTGDQNAEIVDVSGPINDPSGTGAYEFFEVRIAVTTATTGDTATFRLFEDDAEDPNVADDNEILEASEARQTVSISTAGPIASVDVEPETQSSPENIESGDYTVTIKDAQGRTTQLMSGESLNIDPSDVSVSVEETGEDTDADDGTITSDEIIRGTSSFTATGTTAGTYDIVVSDDTTPAIADTVKFVVTEAAQITAPEVDIVTAADTWDGFGNPGDSDGDNTTTYVRVDQNTIRFDFNTDPNEPNANVQLTVDGNGVTFGGQDQATYTTTLDAQGNGSITVTVDQATIQEGDDFDVDVNGTFQQTIEFDRAEADSIDGESAVYFCQDDASCTVTAVVLDQFGNPVTTGEVEASRSGHNNDTTPQRKPVGADGTVDFTFTDTNPADGSFDTVTFEYFLDSFDQTPELTDNSTIIEYSATGQGSDFVVSLDGANTEAPTYKPSDTAIIPLTDTVANTTTGDDDEDAAITIANGEADQAVTLSVDNGALILAPGETDLSEGSASVETTLENDGTLDTTGGGYRIIGTTSGPVTLTVTSAQRTETAATVVKAQDDPNTARNVTLTAPATVPFGTTQIPFVVTVTDAFGNPVPGVPNNVFNKQVSGPGQYQDGDTQTDANGNMTLNVRVDQGATGDITLTVDGLDGYGQFGADEDQITVLDAADSGEGLAASSDEASATTTVEAEVVEPGPINAALTLKGDDNGDKKDDLFANAHRKTEGATVILYRKVDGEWDRIRKGTMNAKGNFRFNNIADKSKPNKKTRYKAVVKKTEDTQRGVGKAQVV